MCDNKISSNRAPFTSRVEDIKLQCYIPAKRLSEPRSLHRNQSTK